MWLVHVSPQSCSDDVRLDAGLQGVECDATQHLQAAEQKVCEDLPIFIS